MKKLRRFSVLALFALSFALVLGGCKNSTSSEEDQTLTPPSNDVDEDDSKAEAVTIVKKGEYKVKVDNQYSQAYINVTGDDKAITKGDLLIVGGTVDAGQVGIKQICAQINYGSNKILQFDNYYDGSSKEKTVKYYKVVRAAEDFTISSIQISVEPLAKEQEATLKDFYIMRLPVANLDELAPEIFHEDEVELELIEGDNEQYNYSASITLGDDKAFSFTKGKTIVGYYDRPVIDAKNDKTKQHFLQFANINWSASSGWVQIYSQINTSGSVLVSYTPEKDFACATVQIGIQDCPETSAKKLKITNLSLRLLPSF